MTREQADLESHTCESGQLVLRLLDELERSVVLRLELEEVGVLLLALLRRLRHLERRMKFIKVAESDIY